MNRFVLFAVVLSVAFDVIVAQSEETVENSDEIGFGSDIAADMQSSAEGLMDSATSTGQELFSAGAQISEEQQKALAEAMNEMATYFQKSIEDMSNIMEDTISVSQGNSETVSTGLVDNLMSYVEDTEMMREQMARVMGIRTQFQDSVLKQLSSMPISAEDAEKLENELRERIQNQAGKISGGMQNFMSSGPRMAQMSQMSQMSQTPQKIASLGSNYVPKF